MGQGWRLRRNDCENCEPGDNCGTHHQSPVPLERQWGRRKRLGDTGVMNCGDNHWMKYEGGSCEWSHLQEANAVTVERHALRISQPVEKDGSSYQLDCLKQGKGRIFSRLDMSGGKLRLHSSYSLFENERELTLCFSYCRLFSVVVVEPCRDPHAV